MIFFIRTRDGIWHRLDAEDYSANLDRLNEAPDLYEGLTLAEFHERDVIPQID